MLSNSDLSIAAVYPGSGPEQPLFQFKGVPGLPVLRSQQVNQAPAPKGHPRLFRGSGEVLGRGAVTALRIRICHLDGNLFVFQNVEVLASSLSAFNVFVDCATARTAKLLPGILCWDPSAAKNAGTTRALLVQFLALLPLPFALVTRVAKTLG